VNVTVTVIVTAGLEAVVFLAVRAYASREAWWRLFGSLLPVSLIVGAVLTLVGSPT
jgi:DNA gyrase inhibitor GyrI